MSHANDHGRNFVPPGMIRSVELKQQKIICAGVRSRIFSKKFYSCLNALKLPDSFEIKSQPHLKIAPAPLLLGNTKHYNH